MPAQGDNPVPSFHERAHQVRYSNKFITKVAALLVGAALMSTAVSGCSSQPTDTLTVVSHDSFVFDKTLIAAFKKASGITVRVLKAGDAGAMTNKLVLTKEQPIGDAVFGIDNTFAGVALKNGILADNKLTAIDFGDVCFNYDKKWFADHKVTPPSNWQDLVKPEYRDLTVVENPATSSTGLSFLASTVAKFGEAGYLGFWGQLKQNGLKVTAGWEDAYYTEFSGSAGSTGSRPIVLSYSSSPADEVRADGKSQTVALLDGAFRQTEYAAVLKNGKNPAGAKLFIDFLLSPAFQSTVAPNMYVYPVNKTVALPTAWALWGKPATSSLGDKLDFNANRSQWLADWSTLFG